MIVKATMHLARPLCGKKKDKGKGKKVKNASGEISLEHTPFSLLHIEEVVVW